MDCQSYEDRHARLKTWSRSYKESLALLKPTLEILIAVEKQSCMNVSRLPVVITDLEKCVGMLQDDIARVDKELFEVGKILGYNRHE